MKKKEDWIKSVKELFTRIELIVTKSLTGPYSRGGFF